MSDPIATTIQTITGQLRTKHGVEPRIGMEWEFQLQDNRGRFVPLSLLQGALRDLNKAGRIGKVYRERGPCQMEITTAPESPLDAADLMRNIQERIAQWASAQNYNLNTSPYIVGPNGVQAATNDMHVNSSLLSAENPAHYLFHAKDNEQYPVNGYAANAVHGLLRVNKQTPLWSHQGADDLVRLAQGHFTPKNYDAGTSKRGKKESGVAVRSNTMFGVPPEEIAYAPFGHESGNTLLLPIRLEERFANTRVDPHVAVFRTLLGHLHGLDCPIFDHHAAVDTKNITLGALPKTWNGFVSDHLPVNSIPQQYVGDLYNAQTLQYIDGRGRNPKIHDVTNEHSPWSAHARKSASVPTMWI